MCFIQELWASDVPKLGGIVDILKRFDHILVGESRNGRAARCGHRPPLPRSTAIASDALKFCAYPKAPERVIDFYALGHIPQETHKALLRMAEAGDFYYMYDTVFNTPVSSHVDHRMRLADMIKRSKYFLVNVASWHKGERIGSQEVLGLRFFEGAAGGAVLIGEAPRNDLMDEFFGWQDSVVPLPFDSGDVAAVIAELEADPGRLERISKTNMVNCLRRHDHVYRWEQILSLVGLAETEAMERRRHELAALAASIERSMPGLADAINNDPHQLPRSVSR